MNVLKKCVLLLCISVPVLSAEISVTGVIKDTDGAIIKNALIRFENAGYVTVTNTQGGFFLSEKSPVQRELKQTTAGAPFQFDGTMFHFTVSKSKRISFSVYTLQGKIVAKKEIQSIESGRYGVRTASLMPRHLAAGTYCVAASIGSKIYSGKWLHQNGTVVPFSLVREHGVPQMRQTARTASVVDTITISKLGYVSQEIPVENYKADIGVVTLQKSNALDGAVAMTKVEDSLFTLFIERVKVLDNLEGPDELRTIDYISIRNGFEAILEKDSLRMKANVGFILSALASLNVNSEVWKIADSLDAYFTALDESPDEPQQLMKKAMQQGGVLALGKAMAVKTPEIALTGVQNPSFPKFLTISYLQNVIEEYLLTVLDDVQKAAVRIENSDAGSMEVTVDGDTYDLDKGEVYLFDATVSLLRAYCAMMCAYDMDLYTSAAKKDYSWIDTLVNNDEGSRKVYVISGDTLYEIYSWSGDRKNIQTLASLVHYNIEERPEFMTIRKPYHETAFSSLKAVPAKIKSGLAAIRSETDDQKNDILRISLLDSADADMVDLTAEMKEEGISASLADNFSSIEKLMDFMIRLQSGPYSFDEMVDGKPVKITINLSAMFTNPVKDLRTLLPYYGWTNSAEWVKQDVYEGKAWQYYPRMTYNAELQRYDSVYCINVYKEGSDEVDVRIDPLAIDSVVTDEMGYFSTYYVKTPIRYSAYIDSNYYFDALRLKDDKGVILSNDQIDALIENKLFFPYFKDYTFNGLFPDMTREKWLDLLWNKGN